MDFSCEKFTKVVHRNLWGEWTLVFEKSSLCQLRYSPENPKHTSTDTASMDAPPQVGSTYRWAVQQLDEYLCGTRENFSIPYKLYGTEFQIKVWKSLKDIPRGETRSYGEIARIAGYPKAIRAVGGALHANPIPLILPCHRVIGKAGSLVGFALGLEMKRRLLMMEGAIPREMRLE